MLVKNTNSFFYLPFVFLTNGLFMEMCLEITTADYPKNNLHFVPSELLRQSQDALY